jgi:23S rRNA pseudouridine1911/1915/1917 synthase
LNHLHHSLLGDKIYGPASEQQPKWKALPNSVQEKIGPLPGQALHARILGFKHPVTGQELHFEADPYPEFQALLDELKKFA